MIQAQFRRWWVGNFMMSLGPVGSNLRQAVRARAVMVKDTAAFGEMIERRIAKLDVAAERFASELADAHDFSDLGDMGDMSDEALASWSSSSAAAAAAGVSSSAHPLRSLGCLEVMVPLDGPLSGPSNGYGAEASEGSEGFERSEGFEGMGQGMDQGMDLVSRGTYDMMGIMGEFNAVDENGGTERILSEVGLVHERARRALRRRQGTLVEVTRYHATTH